MFLANYVWWSWSECFGMHPCVMNVFTLVEMNHTRGCAGKRTGVLFNRTEVGRREPTRKHVHLCLTKGNSLLGCSI